MYIYYFSETSDEKKVKYRANKQGTVSRKRHPPSKLFGEKSNEKMKKSTLDIKSPLKKATKKDILAETTKRKVLSVAEKKSKINSNKNNNSNSTLPDVSVVMTDIKDCIRELPYSSPPPIMYMSSEYDMPLEERVKMRRAHMKSGNKAPLFLGDLSLPRSSHVKASKSNVVKCVHTTVVDVKGKQTENVKHKLGSIVSAAGDNIELKENVSMNMKNVIEKSSEVVESGESTMEDEDKEDSGGAPETNAEKSGVNEPGELLSEREDSTLMSKHLHGTKQYTTTNKDNQIANDRVQQTPNALTPSQNTECIMPTLTRDVPTSVYGVAGDVYVPQYISTTDTTTDEQQTRLRVIPTQSIQSTRAAAPQSMVTSSSTPPHSVMPSNFSPPQSIVPCSVSATASHTQPMSQTFQVAQMKQIPEGIVQSGSGGPHTICTPILNPAIRVTPPRLLHIGNRIVQVLPTTQVAKNVRGVAGTGLQTQSLHTSGLEAASTTRLSGPITLRVSQANTPLQLVQTTPVQIQQPITQPISNQALIIRPTVSMSTPVNPPPTILSLAFPRATTPRIQRTSAPHQSVQDILHPTVPHHLQAIQLDTICQQSQHLNIMATNPSHTPLVSSPHSTQLSSLQHGIHRIQIPTKAPPRQSSTSQAQHRVQVAYHTTIKPTTNTSTTEQTVTNKGMYINEETLS